MNFFIKDTDFYRSSSGSNSKATQLTMNGDEIQLVINGHIVGNFAAMNKLHDEEGTKTKTQHRRILKRQLEKADKAKMEITAKNEQLTNENFLLKQKISAMEKAHAEKVFYRHKNLNCLSPLYWSKSHVFSYIDFV